MKKFLLITALVVAAMATNATDLSKVQKIQMGKDSKRVEAAGSFDFKDIKSLLKERQEFYAKAKAGAYDAADHYYIPGEFHLGIYEGLSGYSFAATIIPFLDSVTYYNMYGATDWSVNGKLVAENSATYTTGYGVNGMYYLPQTADHDFVDEKGNTKHIKGSIYGLTGNGQYLLSAVDTSVLGGAYVNMTLCAMECDTLEDTGDMYRVGDSKGLTGDTYLNGTDMHLTKGAETTIDTIGILVENRGLMKFEEILVPIYNNDQPSDPKVMIPEDAEIRVAIFPLLEDGIDFSDTIASTVATLADYIGAGEGYEWIGTLGVKFYETDILGETTQVPLWIDGNFYVQFTNFNEGGCHFGIFCDFNNPITATTVVQHDGEFSFRGRSDAGGGEFGQNLAVSFVGYYPTLINDTTINELNATAEEGTAYFGEDPEDIYIWLGSNVDYTTWEVETDEESEWLGVAIASTDYWADYGYLVLVITTEALPEGVDSREGQITIIADGAEQVFTVKQSVNAPQAIGETTVDAKFDGKTFDVLGREVKNDVKGVVIRNGQKFVR